MRSFQKSTKFAKVFLLLIMSELWSVFCRRIIHHPHSQHRSNFLYALLIDLVFSFFIDGTVQQHHTTHISLCFYRICQVWLFRNIYIASWVYMPFKRHKNKRMAYTLTLVLIWLEVNWKRFFTVFIGVHAIYWACQHWNYTLSIEGHVSMDWQICICQESQRLFT
jgi:hypothetical protein